MTSRTRRTASSVNVRIWFTVPRDPISSGSNEANARVVAELIGSRDNVNQLFSLSREPISSGSNEANSLFVQRQRLWNDRLAKALVARGMNRVGIGACTVTSRSLKKSSGMNQTSLRAFL